MASRSLERAAEFAARARHPARARELRGAARRPRGRGGLHPAAQRAARASGRSRALEAGKHVLCEKPLARAAGRGRALLRRRGARAGCVLSEAFMWRHHPQAEPLVELVATARSASCGSSARRSPSCSTGRRRRALGRRARRRGADGRGLLLRERARGCWPASPSGWRGERVIAPTAWTRASPAVLRFPGDVLATFDCGFDLPARDELEAIGSEGSLLPRRPVAQRRAADRAARRRRLASSASRCERANPYRLELEDVVGRDPRRARAAARARRRDGPGAGDRGPHALGGRGPAGRLA